MIPKLLPDEYAKKIKRDYRFRLIVVILWCSITGIAIGVGSIVPAYILSRGEEAQAVKLIAELKQSRASRGADETEKEITRVQGLIDSIESEGDNPSASNPLSIFVEDIANRKNAGIKINSFNLVYESTSTIAINISGHAGTRDQLIIFKKNLENESFFSKVDLPISDLAKSKDITFNIQARVELLTKK